MEPDKQLWFRAKSYGWGWTPITWQGWAVLLGCLLIGIVPYARVLKDYNKAVEACAKLMAESDVACIVTRKPVWEAVAWLLLSIVILTIVAYKKGEKPKWQWGPDKETR